MTTQSRTRPHLQLMPVILLCAAALTALNSLFRHREFWHDDAFITARYARRLALDGQLSWNLHDSPVEGFTSVLDVLMTAPLHWLPWGIQFKVQLLHGLVWCGALAYAWIWTRRRYGLSLVGIIPFAWLLSTEAIWAWVLGGLETPVYVAGVLIAVLGTVDLLGDPLNRKRALVTGLCLGSLFAIRPDGALFGLVAGLSMTFTLVFSPGPRRERMLAWVTFAVSGLAPAVLLSVTRLAVFREWLPNTVYAKGSGTPLLTLLLTGLDYCKYAFRSPSVTLLLAGLIASIAMLIVSRNRLTLFLCGCFFGLQLLVASAGGDHMPKFRLLLPALIPAMILLAEALSRTPIRVQQMSAWAYLCLLIVQVFLPRRVLHRDAAALVGEAVGRTLTTHFVDPLTIGVATAGSTPYFADHHRFIDTLGLNDSHISRSVPETSKARWSTTPGHMKGDAEYLLSQHPDLVIVGPAEGTHPNNEWFVTGAQLAQMPEFFSAYTARMLPLAYDKGTLSRMQARGATPPMNLTVYVRNDSPANRHLLRLPEATATFSNREAVNFKP